VRDYWLTARRGTLSAIVQGALSVDGVASAQAIEALNTSGQPARVVNLYVADANGIANQALGATVQAALDDYRAAGITVLVATSLPLLVNIELSLTFAANIDTLSLTDTVKSAVVEYVNSLPVNGTLYVAQLYSVLQRYVADGLIPTHGSIAVPTGDLVPGVGQTIRTTLENITVLS
jgi:hypothetical protein